MTGVPTGGHRTVSREGGGGLCPQPPDRMPLGGDGLDTRPCPMASVTYRTDTVEENQIIGSSHTPPQRATMGGVLCGGLCPQPPPAHLDRGSDWEAGPPCLLGAGSKATLGRPPNRPPRKSRKGGSPVQPFGGAPWIRQPHLGEVPPPAPSPNPEVCLRGSSGGLARTPH